MDFNTAIARVDRGAEFDIRLHDVSLFVGVVQLYTYVIPSGMLYSCHPPSNQRLERCRRS